VSVALNDAALCCCLPILQISPCSSHLTFFLCFLRSFIVLPNPFLCSRCATHERNAKTHLYNYNYNYIFAYTCTHKYSMGKHRKKREKQREEEISDRDGDGGIAHTKTYITQHLLHKTSNKQTRTQTDKQTNKQTNKHTHTHTHT
jgi:hypothetical protein